MTISQREWEDVISNIEENKTVNTEDNVTTNYEYYIDMTSLPEDFPGRILDCPDDALNTLKYAVRNLYGIPVTKDIGIVFKNFSTIMSKQKVRIHQLRARSYNQVVMFDGMVRLATEVLPRVKIAAYEHIRGGCSIVNYVEQYKDKEELPTMCQCGVEVNRNSLRDREDLFVHEDYQSIEVEEDPESLKGRQPERIECHMHGPFTKEGMRVSVGDRVTVLGVYRIRRKEKETVEEKYVEVIGVESKGKNYEDLVLTDEEKKKFEEMSQNVNLLDDMAQSFAPNIEGGDYEKKAIVLQLFGGNFFPTEKRRGNIHILLIGEPSTMKTKLANYTSEIAPHCVRATGGSTTSAGLISTARKDEYSGRWILEAGATVLADMGILIADELDKMKDEVKGALHEILEDGTATVNKAGISAVLQARCAFLGIMNPKLNRFDPQLSTASQINLVPSLLSRFDLVFALKDKVNEDKDRKVATAMFRARSGERPAVKYEQEVMTKYIIYARSKVHEMTIDMDAEQLMIDRFIKMRKANADMGADDVIAITYRQLEGMSRLAEAHAKMRLSDRVTVDDAKVAIDIIEYYLKTMCMDDQGYINSDATTGGITKSEKMTKLEVKDKLVKIAEEDGWGRKYSMRELLDLIGGNENKAKREIIALTEAHYITMETFNDITLHKSLMD